VTKSKRTRRPGGKVAVVMPWRDPEPDRNATMESAVESLAGVRGDVISIQDTTRAGPARMRHAGIERATTHDVIITVDAHMRFDGDVLARMARHVRKHGGLVCAICHHNPQCAFDGIHPSGAGAYYGADIHYFGEDQNGRQALCWKWNADHTPGPRACVGGACYAFRRDWYYDVGQPLAALPGWGCDEEALSISAWLSGHQPAVFDGHVAHRWRPRPPWQINDAEARAVKGSRVAMLSAVVSDPADRRELLAWQGATEVNTPEVLRWRAALAKQPRTWAQWREAVPMRSEVARAVAIMPARAPVIVAPGPVRDKCPHDWRPHHEYPNGKRLLRCWVCGVTRGEAYAQ
jgi:hypothetical protein